jgi:hypothetical protein
MSARTKSTAAEACRDTLPEVDPIDDALWHLQTEVRRVAQLVDQHGLNSAQRRELQRALAILRGAAEWQATRSRETEPAV